MSITSFRRLSARAALVPACLAVAGLLASANAYAWNPPEPRSVIVDYRDLNMSPLAGATTLYTRIRGAARQLCGDASRDLFAQRARNLCLQHAIEGAVNSPLLTKVYRRENPLGSVTALAIWQVLQQRA
jgi:UrcA family protein